MPCVDGVFPSEGVTPRSRQLANELSVEVINRLWEGWGVDSDGWGSRKGEVDLYSVRLTSPCDLPFIAATPLREERPCLFGRLMSALYLWCFALPPFPSPRIDPIQPIIAPSIRSTSPSLRNTSNNLGSSSLESSATTTAGVQTSSFSRTLLDFVATPRLSIVADLRLNCTFVLPPFFSCSLFKEKADEYGFFFLIFSCLENPRKHADSQACSLSLPNSSSAHQTLFRSSSPLRWAASSPLPSIP
jgi:hypothetical protein